MALQRAGLLLISEANVSKVLDNLKTQEILATVGKALHTFSAGEQQNGKTDTSNIQNPLRISVSTPNHNLLFMPSRLGSEATTSVKVVSVPRKPEDKTGLPATTLIFDESTGQAKAVMNARALTAVRTAAASALAISLSKTALKARTLLIYGTGLQALWHARLVASLCPELQMIVLAARSRNERSEALQRDLQLHFAKRQVSVEGCSIAESVGAGGHVESADIICCCTPTISPLFSGDRLKSGASVTLIGSYKPHMREVDLVPLFKSGRTKRVIVDSRSACLAEAGELCHLKDAEPSLFADEAALLPELGTLLDANGLPAPVEQSGLSDVNVFKCVGMGVMDSAISALILRKAEELGEFSSCSF